MAYSSVKGRRPFETASKSSHSQIINDPAVLNLIQNCRLPIKKNDIDLNDIDCMSISGVVSDIQQVVAIDGGYTEVEIEKGYPSSTICFFQFGALLLSLQDLENLDKTKYIDPEDIAKLNKIDRLKLALPSKHVCRKDCKTLTETISKTIYEFFRDSNLGDDTNLLSTLKWILYEEYLPNDEDFRKDWVLASCPYCNEKNIVLERQNYSNDYTQNCPYCCNIIRITDVFRLHEAVDDIQGAGGIMGYVCSAVEQTVLAHLFKRLKSISLNLLKSTLFIKDGPLSFPGQTANIHEPMRKMVIYYQTQYELKLAGLEKSGRCVEHASMIEDKLDINTALLLSTKYLYSYIYPGDPNTSEPFAKTSYYGGKIIFKSQFNQMYVVTLPIEKPSLKPKIENYKYIHQILSTIGKLKCDMYDSALIPVAMANKLVSLSDLPSSKILTRFATSNISK